jgi:hypothetical protein
MGIAIASTNILSLLSTVLTWFGSETPELAISTFTSGWINIASWFALKLNFSDFNSLPIVT